MEIIIQLRNAQVAEDFKGIVNEKLKALARFNVKIVLKMRFMGEYYSKEF